MRAANVPADQGRVWLRCGYAAVSRRPEHWFGMAFVYLLVAFTLKLIPFVGDLLLILVSPLMLAGALLSERDHAAESEAPPGHVARGWGNVVEAALLAPARALFQVATREEYVFATVFLCILALGTVMVVGIMEYLLTGGSIISGLAASSLAAPFSPWLVLRMLVLVVLYVLTAMGLFYLVPLTLFEGMTPMAAMAESFAACRHNAGAHLWLLGTFLAPTILILFVSALWHVAGYMLMLALGLLALPLFVAGIWCSYTGLYRS